MKWLFIPAVYLSVIGVFYLLGDAKASPSPCHVVSVTDGDTFRCVAEGELLKVRIREIDAPEIKQPYGVESKKYLQKLIDKKTVILNNLDTDRYNRTLADVQADSLDVAREMVTSGSAWVYEVYSESKSLMYSQRMASYSRIGLWGNGENAPIQPWLWRRMQKEP